MKVFIYFYTFSLFKSKKKQKQARSNCSMSLFTLWSSIQPKFFDDPLRSNSTRQSYCRSSAWWLRLCWGCVVLSVKRVAHQHRFNHPSEKGLLLLFWSGSRDKWTYSKPMEPPFFASRSESKIRLPIRPFMHSLTLDPTIAIELADRIKALACDVDIRDINIKHDHGRTFERYGWSMIS